MASEVVPVVESSICFKGELQARQDSGEVVCLAVVFYKPHTNQLEYHFPTNMSEEEAIAMLRQFKVFPR